MTTIAVKKKKKQVPKSYVTLKHSSFSKTVALGWYDCLKNELWIFPTLRCSQFGCPSYFKWSPGLLSAVLQVDEELLQMVYFQIWPFTAGLHLSQTRMMI